jgi:hypothetical protein
MKDVLSRLAACRCETFKRKRPVAATCSCSNGNPAKPARRLAFGTLVSACVVQKTSIALCQPFGVPAGKVREHGEFVAGEPYVFFADPDGYEVEIWYERPTPVDPRDRRWHTSHPMPPRAQHS